MLKGDQLLMEGDQLLMEARYAGTPVTIEAILRDLLNSPPMTLSRFIQKAGDKEFHGKP